MNEKKTKYMIVSATQMGRQTQNLESKKQSNERVSSFKYLGNLIDKEGRMSECVKDRIQAENRAYAAKYHMLKVRL